MDTPQLIVAFLLIVFLTVVVAQVKKISLSPKLTRLYIKSWLISILTLSILFFLSLYDIYLRGYWTTKIFIWVFIILSSLLFGFGDRNHLNKFVRLTTTVFTFIPIFLAIIFIVFGKGGQIITYKIFEKIGGSPMHIFYDDSEIRIEKDNRGFRNQRTPKLFKKIAIFEIDRGNILGCTHHPDSVKIIKNIDSITLFCYDKAYESSTTTTNPNITKIKR